MRNVVDVEEEDRYDEAREATIRSLHGNQSLYMNFYDTRCPHST